MLAAPVGSPHPRRVGVAHHFRRPGAERLHRERLRRRWASWTQPYQRERSCRRRSLLRRKRQAPTRRGAQQWTSVSVHASCFGSLSLGVVEALNRPTPAGYPRPGKVAARARGCHRRLSFLDFPVNISAPALAESCAIAPGCAASVRSERQFAAHSVFHGRAGDTCRPFARRVGTVLRYATRHVSAALAHRRGAAAVAFLAWTSSLASRYGPCIIDHRAAVPFSTRPRLG